MKATSQALNEPRRRIELLNALMRWKRATLTRADVGLAPRPGARAGLTQDDLAELTGYAVRVISELETGRAKSPSRHLLDSITASLRMNADERRSLWLLATRSAPPPGVYATAPDAGLTNLVHQLYPHPAYVTDAVWTVHTYNDAVAEWFVDFGSLPAADRNIAKWILCYPHSQHVFVNWRDDFAKVFVSRLRAVAARFPDDERLHALVEELRRRSAFFDHAWTRDSEVYLDAPTETRVFRRPGHTNPDQADDANHHVPMDMVILVPLRPDDERRVVVFLLPDSEPHHLDVRSADACTACAGRSPTTP